jgi:ribosomal protein S18 acetylase RimI-like enzyme
VATGDAQDAQHAPREAADVGAFEEEFLALEAAASAPYSRFVFDSEARAAEARAVLWARGLCEFSPPAGRLFLLDGRPAGMIAALTGRELARRRLAAGVALATSELLAADPALRDRLRLAGRTLLKAAPDDFYLSRIATHRWARGRGVGAALLERVLEEGRRTGCPRCVLEVAPESAAAAALYARFGFREVDRRVAEDPASGRRLEYAHLSRAL